MMPRCVMIARLQHHHMSVLMQRQRKLRSIPVVTGLITQISELSTYNYRSVRAKAQPALISCVRRYRGACGRIVPAMLSILEDTSNCGHAYEQRVVVCQ
jgi:hypothetical protein